MLSWSAALVRAALAVRRAVERAIVRRSTVERSSAAEQAFPALTLAAHLRASAMVIIFEDLEAIQNHLKQTIIHC